jgi:hypothetical protein
LVVYPTSECNGAADVCKNCTEGIHKILKIRTQFCSKTQLAVSNFMDPEITQWVERLRPLEYQEIDVDSLNPESNMTKRLRQKIDKIVSDLNGKMDTNSVTVSKVNYFLRHSEAVF